LNVEDVEGSSEEEFTATYKIEDFVKPDYENEFDLFKYFYRCSK